MGRKIKNIASNNNISFYYNFIDLIENEDNS